jgi:hypothetical protein
LVLKFASNSIRFRGYSSATLAYYRLGLPESSGYPPSGIINGSEISNLQNWTVGLGASRKNAFGPEGWAAIPACFIPICAGACACMGHWIVRSSRNHYWIQTDRVS